MSFIHLKDRQIYEDRYDSTTVFRARIDMKLFLSFRDKWLEKMPENEENKYRNSWHLNHLYMITVGSKLVDRYNDRESAIAAMMADDEARDVRMSAARLNAEPYCEHCGKTGLRITDKMFMHRDGKDDEDVLFMLRCPRCEKNTAVWEDSSLWERRHTKCPNCQSVMEEKSNRRAEVITTTYTCPKCSHMYEDKLDLKREEEPEDPDYDEDRRIYCLQDETIRKEHQDAKYRLDDLIRLGKEMKEKQDNADIYDAVAAIKKPKIAELIPLLQPVLEKAGYIEFSLDRPEMGKDVFVGFNCLDTKSDRNDYDSTKTLEKLVKKTLADTNWRLMSDGIRYRLGYLSGRIRAYEREEDLKQLVTKGKMLKTKRSTQGGVNGAASRTLKGKNGETIIL